MGASWGKRNIGGGNESTGFNIGNREAAKPSEVVHGKRAENGPTPVLCSELRRVFPKNASVFRTYRDVERDLHLAEYFRLLSRGYFVSVGFSAVLIGPPAKIDIGTQSAEL